MTGDAHLARAYEIARSHHPHPNPRVGAVVVSAAGEVIGEGAHSRPGEPHAEVLALEGVDARGATMYVSLEPCSHHGRTPPCVDALLASGLERVVVGAVDPDPRVNGKGIETLRSEGVAVEVKDDPRAVAVDAGYFHHRTTGLPLVTVKYAMTLDGMTAAADSSSQWITGELARADAHRLRSEMDAVVVGAGTLRADDPRLDARIDGHVGPQPRPVVLAGSSELDLTARIWERDPLIISTRPLEPPSGEVAVVEGGSVPEPEAAARELAGRGLYDVLLEGGSTVSGDWWRKGMISKGVIYVGSLVGGGTGIPPMAGVFDNIDGADKVAIDSLERIGSDIRIDFHKD